MTMPNQPNSYIDRIFALAVDVAAAPPLKKGQYVYAAGVPWRLIEQLREALEAAGIDWKAYK